MSSEPPRGILRNAKTHDYSRLENQEYNRKQVLENTRKNAELFKTTTEGQRIKDEIAKKKEEKEREERKKNDANVQFNKQNLEANDKLKSEMTFMKIDEPKTPYQGTIDENSDYYRDDDSVGDFSLGEGEEDDDESVVRGDSLGGSQIITKAEEEEAEEANEAEEAKPEVLAEQLKHKKFEEMRKKHYHHEVVGKLSEPDDDDDDDDDEDVS